MASVVVLGTKVSTKRQIGGKAKTLHGHQLPKGADAASDTKMLTIVNMMSQLRETKKPRIATETLIWGVTLELAKAVEGLL